MARGRRADDSGDHLADAGEEFGNRLTRRSYSDLLEFLSEQP